MISRLAWPIRYLSAIAIESTAQIVLAIGLINLPGEHGRFLLYGLIFATIIVGMIMNVCISGLYRVGDETPPQWMALVSSGLLALFAVKTTSDGHHLLSLNHIESFWTSLYFLSVVGLIKGIFLLNSLAIAFLSGKAFGWHKLTKAIFGTITLAGMIAAFGYEGQEFPIAVLLATTTAVLITMFAKQRDSSSNEAHERLQGTHP